MAQRKTLQFDYQAALQTLQIERSALDHVYDRLEQARREMLQVDQALFDHPDSIPLDKRPLDAGFLRWPDCQLEDYESRGASSSVGQILDAARSLAAEVDRVVVLGIGGSYIGARALKDACTEPYFNERSRGHRGGWPRLYFAGNNLDNDAAQGLLSLLKNTSPSDHAVDDRWGIVVISKSGGTLETAVAFRQFYRALAESIDDPANLSKRIIPVTGPQGKLAQLADAIGCQRRFAVPEGIGGRYSVLTPVGLLPAALLGLDIVALLRGAWEMNSDFEHQEPGDNPVLDYVAINHYLEMTHQLDIRVLSVWTDALESLGLWYDQLLAESLGKQGRGATPLTALNTRDLHSRAQQHQEGKPNKIYNNLIVDQWRCDPLRVGGLPWDYDQLNHFGDQTLPELMDAAYHGTNQALREDGRPTTEIRLPRCDEHSLGQLFQMLMLATVLEGRLTGINPYGQPGVEKYKRNMVNFLNESLAEQGKVF